MANTMYIKYNSGDYENITLTEDAPELLRDGKGRRYAKIRKFNIDGYLFGSSHANFKSLISTLQTKFNDDDADFELYWDDDTIADIDIDASDATTLRVWVSEYPHLVQGTGPTYASGATWQYRCGVSVFEELITALETDRNLIEFDESITGLDNSGLSRQIYKETITGEAQRFTICAKPLVTATHSIRMVGWHSFPTAPAALLPEYVTQGPIISNMRGPVERFNDNYRRYEIEYQYRYEAPIPMDFSTLLRDWI